MKKQSFRGILFFVALLLALLLSNASIFAQLGPKDTGDFKPTDLNRIKVGDMAPDFTLENADGKAISLSDYRGKKSVVLVFYRGYW
jgi:cytochrome oxidase Cu insertion factor (SCO1/SenC/PrrC family)